MSLFDFDIFSNRASRCETSHFHIILESEFKWPFEQNNSRTKGLFMHEYIHYLQHLSTLCGISLSANYNKMFVEYRSFFESNDTITLPLCLGETDPRIAPFFIYYNKIKGTSRHCNRVDKVSFKQEDIERARLGRTAVPVITFNQETDQWDEINPLFVGYIVVMEGMADMIQRLYDPDVRHEDSPYLIVQRICETEYPEISNDFKMMIALCTCALMNSNPGVGLFDAIEFAKKHPGENGYQLYEHYVKECSIKLPSGKDITILEMFNRCLSDYKNTLVLVFGRDVGYYGKAIDNALIAANTGRNLLLSLLYDDSVLADSYIDILADFYGFPFIESYDLTLWPGQKTRALDAVVAVGFELLYKRFSNKESTGCPREEMCKRYGAFAYECKYDQWNHQGTCPFTAAMHYFRLEGKEFKQVN